MMFALKKLPSLIVLGALLLILTPAVDAVAQNRVEVIVQYDVPPGQVRQAIEALGGEVKAEYTYLGSMYVEVSTDSMEELKSVSGVNSVRRNTPILAPELVWPFGGRGVEAAAGPDPLANISHNGYTRITDIQGFAEDNPASYLMNMLRTASRPCTRTASPVLAWLLQSLTLASDRFSTTSTRIL